MRNFIISERPNELVRHSADKSGYEYVTIQEYNTEQREQCTRLIMLAYQNKQVTGSIVRTLLARMEEQESWAGTFDLYQSILRDILHTARNYEYYDTLERIEKGEALLAAETDPALKKKYKARLDELKAKLNSLTLKEDAA